MFLLCNLTLSLVFTKKPPYKTILAFRSIQIQIYISFFSNLFYFPHYIKTYTYTPTALHFHQFHYTYRSPSRICLFNYFPTHFLSSLFFKISELSWNFHSSSMNAWFFTTVHSLEVSPPPPPPSLLCLPLPLPSPPSLPLLLSQLQTPKFYFFKVQDSEA